MRDLIIVFTRLAFYALCGVALVFVFLSCGSSGGSPDQPSCVEGARRGVSAVNEWPGLDPEVYAERKAKACEGLVEIEGLPWFPRVAGVCDGAHPGGCTNPYPSERRALLRALSSRGITAYIVTQNSNAAGAWYWSDDAFRDYVVGIRRDVEELGIEGLVWVGTPSEPWAHDPATGWRRAQVVREEWPWTLVTPDAGANHPTHRPYFPTISYNYLEVHPCSIEDTKKSIQAGRPTLTVTDCTPVLNPGNPTNDMLFQLAKDANQPLIIYDAYGS